MEVRDTPEYDAAIEAMFPYANDADLICVDCRAERDRWISGNEQLCRILRCQTTYEDFCTRRFGEVSNFVESMLPKIKQRSSQIATEMQPGDELWEWDAGGWHHFAGRAGIAIVRDGKVVKQWCELKS